MENNVLSILKLAAVSAGWSHQKTANERKDLMSFWFECNGGLSLIVGLEWRRDTPDVVYTRCGAYPALTPINLSYVTSSRKLIAFFNDSRNSYLKFRQEQQHRNEKTRRFKPALRNIWKRTITILTTPLI